MTKTAFITGDSSGIGFDLAKQLHTIGYKVYGASRSKPPSPFSWEHLTMDLKSTDSIQQAIQQLKQKTRQMDVLINCAGYGIGNAIEYTTYEEALALYQVNVLGSFEVIKQLLPLLRKSKEAKIINIGSIAGEITIPFQAFYSMNKADLSIMTQALRYELKPFNIDCSVVLPGDTKTNFTSNRIAFVKHDELYGNRIKSSLEKMAKDEQMGMPVETVTQVVIKQLKRKRMKPKVAVGGQYRFFLLLSKILPYPLKEKIIYNMYAKTKK
jgi:short-subunit dehydrogenase